MNLSRLEKREEVSSDYQTAEQLGSRFEDPEEMRDMAEESVGRRMSRRRGPVERRRSYAFDRSSKRGLH